jgi:predicted HTH domain antitoxin
MAQIHLTLPDDAAFALKVEPEALGDELRLAAAVKFYEAGRLSAGVAASLAGIPKPVFLTKLADFGVDTFRLTADELQRDITTVRSR